MEIEAKNRMGAIVIIFIAVIIGITLLGTIANSTYEVTHTQTNSNETVSVATAHHLGTALGWNETRAVVMDLADTEVSSINQVRWSNGTILVSGTDYVAAGYSTTDTENITIKIFNTTTNFIHAPVTNTTIVDYTYYPATYVDNSTGRTILNAFLVLFFVIAIVGGVIGYFLKTGIGI